MRSSSAACVGLVLALGLACGSGVPQQGPGPIGSVSSGPPTVAVLPWTQAAGGEEWSGLGPGLAGLVTSELSGVEGIALVERERLDALLTEVALGDSGYLDPASAQRMGHGVGAVHVVVGSYSILPDGFLMDGRVVTVASGEIVVAASARAPLEDWTTASTEVVAELAAALGVVPPEVSELPDLEEVEAFGRGVRAERRGAIGEAREAFRRSEGWGPSSARLADLDAVLEAQHAAIEAIEDRWRSDALQRLAPDSTHQGAPSAAESVDAVLRWAILESEETWCALVEEQEHFLARNRWRAPRVSRSALERRRKTLKLDDDPVLGRFGFGAPDTEVLLFGPDPLDVRSGWLFAVQQCETALGPVLGAWERAMEGVGDPALEFELRSGHAWLVARHTGRVPPGFSEAVEALGTRAAVGRGEEVAQAAREFTLRGGYTDAELVALAEALERGDGGRLDLSDPVCASWAVADAPMVRRQLERLRREGLDRSAVESLGEIAWLYQNRGCLRDRAGRYPDAEAVFTAARGAVASGICERSRLSTELELRETFLRAGMNAQEHERQLLLALRSHLRCR